MKVKNPKSFKFNIQQSRPKIKNKNTHIKLQKEPKRDEPTYKERQKKNIKKI